MSKLEKVITSKKFKDDMQRHASEQAEFFKVFESLMEYDKDRKIDLCAELEDHEKTNIERMLQITEGNQTKAAERLNMKRTTLLAKMRKYNLI
jgi:transcriptional regulator with GAF, ATPase, and Fis domain